MMIDFGSTWRGIKEMRCGHREPAQWYVRILGGTLWAWRIHGVGPFHCDIWTPIWHDGRGPYVSIGIGPIGINRGY